MFQIIYPEGESSELARYLERIHAHVFGPRSWSAKSFQPTPLTQEIDYIRKYVQDPQNTFELPGQKPVFRTDDQVQQVMQFRLDVEESYNKAPQVKKDDFRTNWANAGITGSKSSSSQSNTT